MVLLRLSTDKEAREMVMMCPTMAFCYFVADKSLVRHMSRDSFRLACPFPSNAHARTSKIFEGEMADQDDLDAIQARDRGSFLSHSRLSLSII